MKNVFLLPTEKPSRLVRIYNDAERENFTLKLDGEVNDSFKEYVNVYIFNDEEIKDGDYAVYLFGEAVQKIQIGVNFTNQKAHTKVILTTDQDLIADGVQAIDDEFLEWFVKNPTCEFVDFVNYNPFSDNKFSVIIPEQIDVLELGQILSKEVGCKHFTSEVGCIKDICSCNKYPKTSGYSKQETLEEAAKKYAVEVNTKMGGNKETYQNCSRLDFIAGAKWQAEKVYTEKEVGELLYNVIGEYAKDYRIMIDGSKLNELFEQFKKK